MLARGILTTAAGQIVAKKPLGTTALQESCLLYERIAHFPVENCKSYIQPGSPKQEVF